jgi:hypothetical protein
MRIDAYRKIGGLIDKRLYAEDLDLFLRMGTLLKFIKIECPKTLGFREHDNRTQKDISPWVNGALHLINMERMGFYPGGEARKRDRFRLISKCLRHISMLCLEHKKYRYGFSIYLKSMGWQFRLMRIRYLLAYPILLVIGLLTRR